MDIRKLQRAIVDGLEDVKAQDIVVFNTEHLSPLFERVIIASGTSNRQTKALASSVRERVKEGGGSVLRTEGEANGEWIIVDCGAAVAHILQPAMRSYYHLEELWGGKPVHLKLTSAPRALVKASEPMDAEPAPAPAAPARKTTRAAKTSAAKKTVARKTPATKTAAKKSTAKKGVARKTAAKKAVAKPATARTGAAPKPAARKPASTASAAAQRPAARSAAAKKAAAPRSGKAVSGARAKAPRGG